MPLQARSSARSSQLTANNTRQRTHTRTPSTHHNRRLYNYRAQKDKENSLQVTSSKQMSFESSFDRCRRLNVTNFTQEDIPDSGGNIKKKEH